MHLSQILIMKNIYIPKPCSENWESMSPQEKGKFCSVCSKCVIDFTEKKHQEIIKIIEEKQDEKICGRFYHHQLHTENPKFFTLRNQFFKYIPANFHTSRITLVIFSLILFVTGCSKSTTERLPITGDIKIEEDSILKNDKYIIGEALIDEDSTIIHQSDSTIIKNKNFYLKFLLKKKVFTKTQYIHQKALTLLPLSFKMKIHLYFYLFLFLNCQSQTVNNNLVNQKTEIKFEDNYHYRYSLTDKNFFVIDTQDKMDKVYSIIHTKNGGRRLAPIPAINNEDTFIIIKPALKNTNDVSVEKMTSDNETLIVEVKAFNNPTISQNSRTAPNILLKILKKISVKRVVIQY